MANRRTTKAQKRAKTAATRKAKERSAQSARSAQAAIDLARPACSESLSLQLMRLARGGFHRPLRAIEALVESDWAALSERFPNAREIARIERMRVGDLSFLGPEVNIRADQRQPRIGQQLLDHTRLTTTATSTSWNICSPLNRRPAVSVSRASGRLPRLTSPTTS